MTTPLLDTIPTCSRTAAQFLSRFEQATATEINQVAQRVAGMTQDELALFDYHVLPLCFDEKLLSLLCETPELMANTSFSRLSGMFSELVKKESNLLLEPASFERLAASLIDLYPNRRRMNFLEALGGIISRDCVLGHPYKPGSLFDAALARHIEEAPSRNFASCVKAMDSLRDVELPQTLAVFLRHLLAKDERSMIITYVSELFQGNNLHESYIEVFKQELGADAFIQLCVKANDMQGCLPSVLKVIPLSGESAFHHREFLGGLREPFNRNLPPYYLQQFVESDMDEEKLPILSQFILENLQSLLRLEIKSTAFKSDELMYAIGFARLATRNDMGAQVLENLLESLRAPLSWNTSGVLDMTLADLVNKLTDKVFEQFPEPKFIHLWDRLHPLVEVVGLEALQKVAPEIDHRFIEHFVNKFETAMTKGQVLRLFPRAKGPMLEDAMGL